MNVQKENRSSMVLLIFYNDGQRKTMCEPYHPFTGSKQIIKKTLSNSIQLIHSFE